GQVEAVAPGGLRGSATPVASDDLVLVVPRDSRLRRLQDAAGAGVEVLGGGPDSAAGARTAAVLERLDPAMRQALRANLRTSADDGAAVVAAVAAGRADAGLAFRSDVRQAPEGVRARVLPRRVRPRTVYRAGVVRGAHDPKTARAFVDALRAGPCAVALRDDGFATP
ncbi:MAG: substrate-binding domain-containing protein, partial [Solirubrobacterales bacterium]|nr:substrate-binding domain-containing protein [Solirubrobacterales bacterium]